MTRFRSAVLIFLILLLFSLATPARAQATVKVVSDTASLSFPTSIDFQAEFQSTTAITSVVLEYGVDQLTCGIVEAKAFPAITAGTDVKVDWTWDMRQSGSLAPGASFWWHWLVGLTGGGHFTSPKQTMLWLDSIHSWQTISGGNINLHYYNGGASFAQQLHDTAAQALVRLSQDVGVSTDTAVNIYIYANTSDLKDSILYEPSWIGGQAFPENNIVILGISPDELDWGKGAEAHELTHVLVGHLTFSCLGFIPTWLNEGLAMVGEGGLQSAQQALLDQAKTADALPALRTLTGAFSDESNRANLSYAEAYSVVNFMTSTYSHDKMTALLLDLRDGQTTDEALQAVYGFNVDGLDNAWRLSIGAKAQPNNSQPTPVPTPTEVPTFVPVGAAPVAVTAPSTPISELSQASSTPAATQTVPATAAPLPAPVKTGLPGLNTYIVIGLACLGVLVILAILAIILIVRSQKRSKK
jgi:hypothetical protein